MFCSITLFIVEVFRCNSYSFNSPLDTTSIPERLNCLPPADRIPGSQIPIYQRQCFLRKSIFKDTENMGDDDNLLTSDDERILLGVRTCLPAAVAMITGCGSQVEMNRLLGYFKIVGITSAPKVARVINLCIDIIVSYALSPWASHSSTEVRNFKFDVTWILEANRFLQKSNTNLKISMQQQKKHICAKKQNMELRTSTTTYLV